MSTFGCFTFFHIIPGRLQMRLGMPWSKNSTFTQRIVLPTTVDYEYQFKFNDLELHFNVFELHLRAVTKLLVRWKIQFYLWLSMSFHWPQQWLAVMFHIVVAASVAFVVNKKRRRFPWLDPKIFHVNNQVCIPVLVHDENLPDINSTTCNVCRNQYIFLSSFETVQWKLSMIKKAIDCHFYRTITESSNKYVDKKEHSLENRYKETKFILTQALIVRISLWWEYWWWWYR